MRKFVTAVIMAAVLTFSTPSPVSAQLVPPIVVLPSGCIILHWTVIDNARPVWYYPSAYSGRLPNGELTWVFAYKLNVGAPNEFIGFGERQQSGYFWLAPANLGDQLSRSIGCAFFAQPVRR